MQEEMRKLAESCTSGLARFQQQLDDLRSKSTVSAPTLETLNSEFGSFRDKIASMISTLLTSTTKLEQRVEELEAKGRRKTLLIHGVKEDPVHADPLKEVFGIINGQLGCSSITSADLEACYRLGPPNTQRTKPRPIIIKFTRRTDRNDVWARKKCLKGTRTLITESLIPARQQIFTEARALFSPANCWTRDGKIIVLYPDGCRETLTVPGHFDTARSRLATFHAASNNANETRPVLRPRPRNK